MEPWIAQNDDLIDVCLEIADKSEDPQLVSQISCGGQHKNAAAVHVWAWPNRQLVIGGCFRRLRQGQPAIPVAAGPFKTMADEAQTTQLLLATAVSACWEMSSLAFFSMPDREVLSEEIGTIGAACPTKSPLLGGGFPIQLI